MKKQEIINKILKTDFSTSDEVCYYASIGLNKLNKKDLEKKLKEWL